MQKFILVIVFFCMQLCGFAIYAADESDRIDVSTLAIVESYSLPISEISGLAWRSNPDTKITELLLVSDRDFKLHVLNWSERHKNIKLRSIDLGFLNTNDQKQSQWEAVQSDESGRVYILQETPPRILVLSTDLKSLLTSITLQNHSLSPHSNTGGEGILLTNQHILVVNEKEPLALFEYGPETQTGNTIYTALHRWNFDTTSRYMLEDASELAQAGDGALYVLSDQKRTIGLLGKSLAASTSTLSIQRYWLLPESITQPEGLVFDNENRPVVAIDSKIKKKNHKKKKQATSKTNLFVLSPIR